MFIKIKHFINAKKLILILPIFLIQFGCKQKEENQTKVKEEQTMESAETSGEKIPPNNSTNRENAIQIEEISSDKKLLATVNGRPIYEEDLKRRQLDDMIVDEILYEDGLRRGLDKHYEKNVELYAKTLIVREQNQNIRSTVPKEEPTDKEIEDFIKQNKKQFETYLKTFIVREQNQNIRSTVPKEKPTDKEIEDFFKQHEKRYTNLKVKGISTSDKNIAEQIHKRAIKGEDFDNIASDYLASEVTFTPDIINLPVTTNDYFDELKVGAITDIIQENRNFLIYRIIEVNKLPISQFKTAITFTVLAQKKYEAVREFAEKAKKEHNIKVEIIQEEK